MKRYKQKPVVAQAIQFDLTAASVSSRMAEIERLCRGSIRGMRLPPGDRTLQFQGRDGEVEARLGDWVVVVDGQAPRVASPAEFQACFEPLGGEVEGGGPVEDSEM